MLDLVRKRHDGDGWLVFTELANSTGFAAKRYADAVALGVWASTKYEAHLYEFKASREDLKKELRDQTKAEAVGKYCTYWWLAVTDENVIRDLVIPDCWGILIRTVRGGSPILKVHRRAPKLNPKPISEVFAIALIRNATKGWKSRADFDVLREENHALRTGITKDDSPEEVDKDIKIMQLEQRIKRMETACEAFKEETGVELRAELEHPFGLKQIGKAFRLAQDFMNRATRQDLHNDVHHLSEAAAEFERRARDIAESAIRLREFLGKEHTERCQRATWSLRCTCGLEPVSEVERKIAGDVGAIGDRAEPDTIEHAEV